MQPKTSQSTGKGLLLAALFLTGILSCGKRTIRTSPDTRMEQTVRLLQGEKRLGSLIGVEDASSLALNYNNGSQYILIDKLPGPGSIEVPSITSAELITSNYGIVIKDLSNNRLVILANNDEKSLRLMQQARALLLDKTAGSTLFGTIFGTTLVNHSRGS